MEHNISDYIPLLNAAGFEAFTLDLPFLKDDTYNIEFIVQEYVSGVLVNDSLESGPKYFTTNRRMPSDFPEEVPKEILSEGNIYDVGQRNPFFGRKIVYWLCSSVDSLKTVSILLENIAEFRQHLHLKPLTDSPFEGRYMYGYRPFETGIIKLGEFTPLVLVGSFWYDDEFKIVRFCGENEIAADFSTKMLTNIPHYYVIGVIVTKM